MVRAEQTDRAKLAGREGSSLVLQQAAADVTLSGPPAAQLLSALKAVLVMLLRVELEADARRRAGTELNQLLWATVAWRLVWFQQVSLSEADPECIQLSVALSVLHL